MLGAKLKRLGPQSNFDRNPSSETRPCRRRDLECHSRQGTRNALLRARPKALKETHMDTTTLLIMVLVILLLGGGLYGRGRWY
jgi:hypothetical protein